LYIIESLYCASPIGDVQKSIQGQKCQEKHEVINSVAQDQAKFGFD